MDAEIHTVIHLYIQHGFNFMADLRKALKNLDVSKLKTSSGKSVSDELKHHAAILADCIMYRLDEVYGHIPPKSINVLIIFTTPSTLTRHQSLK